jgi:uncharacterized protein (DUF983 family)
MTPPRQVPSHARCPRCGSGTLLHGEVAGVSDAVEVFACEDCRDYWFERDGVRLSLDAIRRGGLA